MVFIDISLFVEKAEIVGILEIEGGPVRQQKAAHVFLSDILSRVVIIRCRHGFIILGHHVATLASTKPTAQHSLLSLADRCLVGTRTRLQSFLFGISLGVCNRLVSFVCF